MFRYCYNLEELELTGWTLSALTTNPDYIFDNLYNLTKCSGLPIKLNFRISTPSGMVGVSIFGRAFLKQNLPIGEKIIVIGKYDSSKNIINASDIKFGVLTNQDKIESVYHSTSGLSQKILMNAINNALLSYGNDI